MNNPKSKGALFTNNRREKDTHPNFQGVLEVTGEQIQKLVEMGKAGEKVELRLAGWNSQSKAGQSYISLSAEAYRRPTEAQEMPF